MPAVLIRFSTLVLCLACASPALAGDGTTLDDPGDPVLQAMVSEVERAMADLAGADPAPYFLALEVVETHAVMIAGEEGGLQGYSPRTRRHVDVDVRVGSPQLDSTHALRGARERAPRKGGRDLVLSDDVAILQKGLWREIDKRFVAAQERWAKVESDHQVLVEEAPADDLAPVEPVVAIDPNVETTFDLAAWEQVIREASATLAESAIVHDGSVRFVAASETRWFVSSEGTRLRTSGSTAQLMVMLDTVADDGEALGLFDTWMAATPGDLPTQQELVDRVREMEELLGELRQAPDQEPYAGPAVLSGRAAAVFFHEILGHRLEGHRLKRVDDAQTFRDMVGEPILPPFLSVHDDPTLAQYDGEDLAGHYIYDKEGVPAERVVLVEDGLLKGFLQSRSPMQAGDRSNGHGRREAGMRTVTRQGNLMITASETVTGEELRAELLQRARDEEIEYGLMIEDIHGGFTLTGRQMPNAFDVKVLVGRRVFADGRPDQLVRGIDLIGTPLVAFGRIVRASDRSGVFNGACGAESGWVRVSAVSPALLFSEIETQRKPKGQNIPPLLAPPRTGDEVRAGEEVAP